MDESEKIRDDRERLFIAIEVFGPVALTDHQVIVRRMARRDPSGLKAAREMARASEVGRSRAWWREHARITSTDWSSLLRQRVKVLGWVRAGRPPLSEYMRTRRLAGGRDDE